MTTRAPSRPQYADRPASVPARGTALTFIVLGALTALELNVAVAREMAAAMRATLLAGVLLFKIGVVLVFCLRAELRRRSAARLALVALIMAGSFAAVLMLEAAFQVRVR
jgi:hypothetical protein